MRNLILAENYRRGKLYAMDKGIFDNACIIITPEQERQICGLTGPNRGGPEATTHQVGHVPQSLIVRAVQWGFHSPDASVG